MARVALLLGGNQGDVKRTLQTAQQLVNSRVGAVLRCSHRYESEPWGFPAAERFSNQALEVSTDLTPHEVLDACQRIERELGRNRAAEAVEKASSGAVYCSRPIDIDIIFYDDEVDRRRTPHGSPSAARRAGIRAGAALRDHAPAAASRDGATVGEMLDALRNK